MKILSYVFVLFFIVPIVRAQSETTLNLAEKINADKLKTVIDTIASDGYQGRKTGTEGEQKTAKYLIDFLTKNNVKKLPTGTYLQEIPILSSKAVDKVGIINQKDCSSDYTYPNELGQITEIIDSSFLFVGYGESGFGYDDLYGFDLNNKILLMMDGMPRNKYGLEYVSGNSKMDNLKKGRPKAILKIDNDRFSSYYVSKYDRTYYNYSYKEEMAIPQATITERLANWMLQSTGKSVKQLRYEIERDGEPKSVEIKASVSLRGEHEVTKYGSSNIIGLIEGSDLKDEYIVVMAHYDHEGVSYNEIYNGADDNASGVSAVMEITRVLAEAKKAGKGPRRSIVVIFSTAEEMGLYGSSFYTENPIFPLAQTKGCINLDMLGRIDERHDGQSGEYVYLVANKNEDDLFVKTATELNANSYKLELDATDPDRVFSRSDHYQFYRKDVPAIMITSGQHSDYHRPTDDAEKINIDLLKKRAQLAFLLIWELANDNTTIK